MNKAHVFQHKYTGIQIFVYYQDSKTDAKLEFFRLVVNHEDWVYLGMKIAIDVVK